MTQAPPPYGGYPGYPLPAPPKRRPTWWWFVLGGGLVGAAVVVGIVLFIWTLASFLQTDAKVRASGEAQSVAVDTDGDRMLWLEKLGDQSCRILDQRTGQEIPQQAVSGDFSRSDAEGSWYGAARFDPGSGGLAVTCDGGGTVLIGPAPQFGSLAVSILLTIMVPLVLGLAGIAILIVTGVLWVTRPATPRT